MCTLGRDGRVKICAHDMRVEIWMVLFAFISTPVSLSASEKNVFYYVCLSVLICFVYTGQSADLHMSVSMCVWMCVCVGPLDPLGLNPRPASPS